MRVGGRESVKVKQVVELCLCSGYSLEVNRLENCRGPGAEEIFELGASSLSVADFPGGKVL